MEFFSVCVCVCVSVNGYSTGQQEPHQRQHTNKSFYQCRVVSEEGEEDIMNICVSSTVLWQVIR